MGRLEFLVCSKQCLFLGFLLLLSPLVVLATPDPVPLIPVIDLQAWTTTTNHNNSQDQAVQLVAKACQEIGFFAISNHGVNTTVMDAMWDAARAFFDLPTALKLQSQSTNETDYPYGYERSETLVKSLGQDATPDLKETFALGPDNPLAGMPPRQYPALPMELPPSLDAYYKEMEHLATTLLRIFALALQLPEPWFDDKMDRHMSALRLINYWETTTAYSSTSEPQIRAGAHTDYGALTILKSGGPGLQVQHPHSQTWVNVPTLPDIFIVNLGDLMQRWTNDQWVSTLHRVVGGGGDAKRRQSVAYFVNINGDAAVETLPTCISDDRPQKYPTILAKDHLMAKHLASMGVAGQEESKTTVSAQGKDEL